LSQSHNELAAYAFYAREIKRMNEGDFKLWHGWGLRMGPNEKDMVAL
jgi:hypothetical protein